MSVAELKKTTQQKMDKAVEALKNNLAKVRTGRVHTGIMDQVTVEYYGSTVSLSSVASITLIDARTIGVSPFEKKMAATVEKAIRESSLGLNPASMGEMIRVPMPALTEERRKEMVKIVKGDVENAKVSLRGLRRDANETLKKQLKDKAISEDEDRRTQDEIQKMTDKYVVETDKIGADKEKEILTV